MGVRSYRHLFVMKKVLIALTLTSCTVYKPYSPIKLKNISKDMLYLREMIEYDYMDGKIDEKVARNYFNLMESYSLDLQKEYEKAKAKRDGTKVYKIITITKR